VIRDDSRFRLIRQERQGVSKARNRGYLESSPGTNFITFMDSDDYWRPEALGILVEALEKTPELIGVHGLGEFIDSEGRLLDDGAFEAFGRRRLGYRNGAIEEWPLEAPTCFATLCWAGTVYPPGLLMVRRTAYEAAGLFDESMRFCEDWDMVVRLSRYGELGFLNRVIIQYRRHASNATRDLAANSYAVRRLHYKIFTSSENRQEHHEILRSGWLAWQRYKVMEKWRVAWHGVSQGSFSGFVHALFATPLYVLRYFRGAPGSGFI
jgi:glycosyltransferase involved in cell wall biosynthesis